MKVFSVVLISAMGWYTLGPNLYCFRTEVRQQVEVFADLDTMPLEEFDNSGLGC